MRRRSAGLAVILAAVLVSACRSSDETGRGASDPTRSVPSDPAVVQELIVRDLSPEMVRVPGVTVDTVSLLRASFAETPRIRLADEESPTAYSLGFGLAWTLVADDHPVQEERSGHLFLVARAELGRRLPGKLPEEYAVDLQHEAPYDRTRDGGLSGFLATQVRGLVDVARDRLVLQLQLVTMSDRALLALLETGDDYALSLGAAEAGERGLRAAVPALIRALDRPSLELRVIAIGTLGRLGDPRAVPALVARTSGMSLEEVRLAVRALGDVGGDEARRYLETIQYSHPDESIKATAAEALAALRGE